MREAMKVLKEQALGISVKAHADSVAAIREREAVEAQLAGITQQLAVRAGGEGRAAGDRAGGQPLAPGDAWNLPTWVFGWLQAVAVSLHLPPPPHSHHPLQRNPDPLG
jgi:hypothetical protein